jgi:hypothetical protein
MKKVKFIELDTATLVQTMLTKVALKQRNAKENNNKEYEDQNQNSEPAKKNFSASFLKKKPRRSVFSSGQLPVFKHRPKEIKIKFILRQ